MSDADDFDVGGARQAALSESDDFDVGGAQACAPLPKRRRQRAPLEALDASVTNACAFLCVNGDVQVESELILELWAKERLSDPCLDMGMYGVVGIVFFHGRCANLTSNAMMQ
jgi:hypothetical protein